MGRPGCVLPECGGVPVKDGERSARVDRWATEVWPTILEASVITDRHPDPKDPTAQALPDSSRFPHAPYHPVLSGQPALVTGANSGIGRAVALDLAHAGADVAVNYITHPETADEVAHEIEGMGRRAIALLADVSKE